MKSTAKPFILVVIGGALVSLLSLVIWINVNKDVSGLMFGRVVSIEATSISLADRDNRITTVLVGTGTYITEDRDAVLLTDIPVGQFLQVTGKRINPTTIEADGIRLMRGPRADAPPAPHAIP